VIDPISLKLSLHQPMAVHAAVPKILKTAVGLSLIDRHQRGLGTLVMLSSGAINRCSASSTSNADRLPATQRACPNPPFTDSLGYTDGYTEPSVMDRRVPNLNTKVVPARGLEPRTLGLKDRCSNQAELRRHGYESRDFEGSAARPSQPMVSASTTHGFARRSSADMASHNPMKVSTISVQTGNK
jgi:hypothetical protein